MPMSYGERILQASATEFDNIVVDTIEFVPYRDGVPMMTESERLAFAPVGEEGNAMVVQDGVDRNIGFEGADEFGMPILYQPASFRVENMQGVADNSVPDARIIMSAPAGVAHRLIMGVEMGGLRVEGMFRQYLRSEPLNPAIVIRVVIQELTGGDSFISFRCQPVFDINFDFPFNTYNTHDHPNLRTR